MEALLIPQIHPFGHHQRDSVKMCCSPVSTFGDDFTLILRQNTLPQQNKIIPEKSKEMQPLSEEEETINSYTFIEDTTTSNERKENQRLEKGEKVEVPGTGRRYKKCEIPDDILEKYGTKSCKKAKKKEKIEKKGKRWKYLPNDEMGFKISLFPRPVCDNVSIDYDAEKLYLKIENECDEMENLTQKFEEFQEMEGCMSGNMKLEIRADRDRKVEKAHKQVKTKHCLSIQNNNGRKHLYIHHKVYKLMSMEITISLNCMPSRKKEKITLRREELKNSSTTKPRVPHSDVVAPRPPPQNLAYALDNYNAPSAFDSAVVNILIGLQHRDLTPEDYELLLRLDEQVAPKTVSSNTIKNFKTETIDEASAGALCAICMEVYEIGQTRKFLPCNHEFHSSCIEMWLTNSSVNCPIDNLPVEPS
ncbi:uncharacterized protein LOC133197416 [Saccostrea echinata]|uniref:uncharacterized protein LOC133197416 n=1 Tax=Saccostrea echinata TaxID=191078 RepID=UPI002A838025|nr:uncharacterized protein LOC133197416 [Saccostrea echinata]